MFGSYILKNSVYIFVDKHIIRYMCQNYIFANPVCIAIIVQDAPWTTMHKEHSLFTEYPFARGGNMVGWSLKTIFLDYIHSF